MVVESTLAMKTRLQASGFLIGRFIKILTYVLVKISDARLAYVIPAKAGIQIWLGFLKRTILDPRFRGDDANCKSIYETPY